MTDLNKLSIAIKKLQTDIGISKKYTLEAIGTNRDMYQNILPICFDIQVLHEQKNIYNQADYSLISDAYFIDGVGPSFTKANYTISPILADDGQILDYKCEYTPYIDVNTFTTYLTEQKISFF